MAPKPSGPWQPVKFGIADVAALQALRRGEADADQQIRAIEYIIGVISARNDMSYRPGPDGALDTAFSEGRRYVGNQIVRLTKLSLSKLKEDKSQ